jgi:hypothetical protein
LPLLARSVLESAELYPEWDEERQPPKGAA